MVFSLSPRLVKILGYFRLHALNVACLPAALPASGKHAPTASVFSCRALHKETVLDSPGLTAREADSPLQVSSAIL